MRRRFEQSVSLQDRVIEWAAAVRKEAAALPSGAEQDTLLKKVRQTETAMKLDKWADTAGLQPPE